MEPFVRPFEGHEPDVAAASFIAPGAVVVGRVSMARGSSVFYGCVVRADLERIEIGEDVNIQDGCILHADPDFPVVLGARSSLGHGAIVHGAIIEEDVLVGMRATVLNGARIGSGSVIAAGAVVRPGMQVPPNSLVVGVPAQVRKETGEAERELIHRTNDEYVRLSVRHQKTILG